MTLCQLVFFLILFGLLQAILLLGLAPFSTRMKIKLSLVGQNWVFQTHERNHSHCIKARESEKSEDY